MRSNYRKIGDFIKRVKIKNSNGEIDLLLGVNLDKKFIPSVANIIGTDLTKYNVIKKGQFGCKLMSVGRDKKLPISLLKNHEKAIISSAYFVFEVKDNNILNTDYLMMWFSRSESDRYLWFQSGGDVRGRITWDDLCSLPIKVPSIEKQREIVTEYNTIANRIKLNETLNQKLEETAQAIYKEWFVDFEFPNEDGKPYKSNGGKMVFNEELDKDVPEGWGVGYFGQLIEPVNGYAFKSDDFSENGDIAIIKIKNLIPPHVKINDAQFLNGILTEKLKRIAIKKSDVLVTMTGSGANQMKSAVGQVGKYYGEEIALLNQRICKLEPKHPFLKEYIFQFISGKETHLELLNGSTGSANQANISPTQIKTLKILISNEKVWKFYQKLSDVLDDSKRVKSQDNLEQMKDLLLSKMTKTNL